MEVSDFEFVWSKRAEDFFQEKRIFLRYPWKIERVVKIGSTVRISRSAIVEPYSNMNNGIFFSCGSFSYCRSKEVTSDLKIGRYCSLAQRIRLSDQEHPMDRISTHPFTTHSHMRKLASDEWGVKVPIYSHTFTGPPPTIGNDVWIGSDAMIKRGITIGHGAVIGARAVVTRDVEPYSVVAGVPAKHIRYRIPEYMIESMLETEWWDYNYIDFSELDPRDIESFPVKFCELINKKNIQKMPNKRIFLANDLEAAIS